MSRLAPRRPHKSPSHSGIDIPRTTVQNRLGYSGSNIRE